MKQTMPELDTFKELILKTCGFSFENERTITLKNAIKRRMHALNTDSAGAYLQILGRDKAELDRLVELLTVNETYFFREPAYLGLLVERLLPEIMGKRGTAPVKILSAGCSTGEEPYSIAIMLREKYGKGCEAMFSVVGVDIDAAAIAAARQGVFRKSSFRGMDEDMRRRYFESCPQGGGRLRDDVRSQVVFQVANLLAEPYPECMRQPDIILYRNVSIYFPRPVQNTIFSRLAGELSQDGYFLVGAAETLHHDIGVLSLAEMNSLFLYRKSPALAAEGKKGSVTGDRKLPPKTPSAGIGTFVVDRAGKGGQDIPALVGKKPAAPSSVPVNQLAGVGRKPDGSRHFQQALEQARSGQYDAALAMLESLVSEGESTILAHRLRGSIQLSSGLLDEARASCNQALLLDQFCVEAHLMLGVIARHQGSGDQSLERFRTCIYLEPACWLAHFYLAETVFASGDRKRAQGGYETTLRILQSGTWGQNGQELFPLSCNTEQFLTICRHKLSLLVK